MTALAGVWCFDGPPDAAECCSRMLASQEIYGPHDSAQWSDGGTALGRRLMRVLPEDKFDRQPLIGGGGRYVLVADLRLDNRDELIKTLAISPEKARQSSDAAILLAAIERWEDSCLEHLLGDYAFALWDSGRHRLILARDPLGQRPLHYHRGSRFLAFASMPKGLHALAEVPYAPDENRIAQFLALMPEVGTQSFFRGIERVEPGHVVTVTPASLNARRHWQPKRGTLRLRRSEDYSEALRELLDRAVGCRLRGAEDIGAELSGGLDSGAVAATAARLLAPKNRRVIAFTAVPREGYAGPATRYRIVDEGPHAAATAAQYSNIEHVLVPSQDRSPLDALDQAFFFYDRPVLNICNLVWVNSIRNAARKRKLGVVLSGRAGNMGFSYDGRELLAELFASGFWLRWWQQARALVVSGRVRWRGVLAQTLGPWCPAPLWVWCNKLAHEGVLDFADSIAINSSRLAELQTSNWMGDYNWDPAFRPWKDGFAKRLQLLRWVDIGNYNKGTLGGWQIDYRDPTADVRLLEFCLAVPTSQFLSDGNQRALAKRVLADRLPKLVLEEDRRGLQAADWHERLTADRPRLATEFDRFDSCPATARVLDLPRLRGLVENWPASGWEREEMIFPYRWVILRAISTGHFLRRSSGVNL